MKPVSPDGEAFAKEFVRRLQKAVQRGEQRLAFCCMTPPCKAPSEVTSDGRCSRCAHGTGARRSWADPCPTSMSSFGTRGHRRHQLVRWVLLCAWVFGACCRGASLGATGDLRPGLRAVVHRPSVPRASPGMAPEDCLPWAEDGLVAGSHPASCPTSPPVWPGPTERGRRLIAQARELLARARRWRTWTDGPRLAALAARLAAPLDTGRHARRPMAAAPPFMNYRMKSSGRD